MSHTITDISIAERGTRRWQWAAAIVAGLVVALIVGGYVFLLDTNASLRVRNVQLYNDLSASQANAGDLYRQLLELGERPAGEDPDDVATTAPPGPQGLRGETGPRGPIGPVGLPGMMGMTGPPGAPGADGRDGIDGEDGADGIDGADGAPGAKGDKGDPGQSGVMESYTLKLEGRTLLCVIDGTPPPFTYVCEAAAPVG